LRVYEGLSKVDNLPLIYPYLFGVAVHEQWPIYFLNLHRLYIKPLSTRRLLHTTCYELSKKSISMFVKYFLKVFLILYALPTNLFFKINFLSLYKNKLELPSSIFILVIPLELKVPDDLGIRVIDKSR